MKSESGRSLIEVIGVIAISGAMILGAYKAYEMAANSGRRQIASARLEQIANDVKLLMEMGGTYDGVSVDYLVKSGSDAAQNGVAPLGGNNWSVTAGADGKTFEINLVDLTEGECAYFTTAVPKWAAALRVNGYETDAAAHCFASKTNQISFIVR